MKNKSVEILLVEDDLGDIELMRIALQRNQLLIPLQVVNDGEEALDYLRKQGQYTDVLEPDLILLDLNLPGLNGQEVLKIIKTDQQLKHIPVVILTTSNSQEEIFKSYNFGANAYLTKPVDLEGFANIISSLDGFWFTLVKFPGKN